MWSILPHLPACAAGESLFLLDLRQDRYFRVPARLVGDGLAWLRDGDNPPDGLIALLRRGGIWRPGDGDIRDVTEHPATVPVSLPGVRIEREIQRGGAAGVALCVGKTWSALRFRSLRSVIDRRRSWRGARVWTQTDLAQERIATFERGRRLLPLKRNCLLDSLSLDAWLSEDGPDRRIVFGVTPEPFHAHCWVQSSRAILNDVYDHVRQYTPILIV